MDGDAPKIALGTAVACVSSSHEELSMFHVINMLGQLNGIAQCNL